MREITKKMKIIIFLVISILLKGCSSEINLRNDELKLFAYAELLNEIILLTLSTDEKICSGKYYIAISAINNNKNQFNTENYFCWEFNEPKEVVHLYEPNFIKFKVKKIDVNKFVLIKSKEQLAIEKSQQNFENFITNEERKNESSKKHLGLIQSVINGEPRACLFISNILNCE